MIDALKNLVLGAILGALVIVLFVLPVIRSIPEQPPEPRDQCYYWYIEGLNTEAHKIPVQNKNQYRKQHRIMGAHHDIKDCN